MVRSWIYSMLKYIFVIFFLVMALLPIVIIILNSFKNSIEINRITFLPERLQLVNYFTILSKPDYYLGLFNSVFYAGASSIAATR
jgi:ABC-type glycerol-3-phosphate transport system permease component